MNWPSVESISPMSSASGVVERKPQQEQAASSRLGVYLEFSIRAETRKLFHALTMPEYMETWFCFPTQHADCSTMVTMLAPDYLVEHQCHGRPTVYITGSYSVCQRHNLAFSWRVQGGPNVNESSVDIRLRGDFERTTLILCHTQFETSAQCQWHRNFWNASIRKLIGLYESPISTDVRGGSSQGRPLVRSFTR